MCGESSIKDQTQKHIPLNTVMTMVKAKSSFAMLRGKAAPSYHIKFTAISMKVA